MKTELTRKSLIVTWLAMPLLGQTPQPLSRAVTVADSIEMNVVSSSREGIAYFSPDKSQFVVLTHKGNIAANNNDYSLWLFRSADVFQSAHAEAIATVSSTTNQPAIRDIRWVDDKTIVFLGATQANAKASIYSLDVPAKKVNKLHEYEDRL